MRSCGACLLPSLFAALLAAQEKQPHEQQGPKQQSGKQQPEKQQPGPQPEWLQAGRPPDAKALFAALGRLPGLSLRGHDVSRHPTSYWQRGSRPACRLSVIMNADRD